MFIVAMSSDPPSNCSDTVPNSKSNPLKLYQFFVFCVPIFFTFILLFLFYFFYLRPRRVNWSSLRMRTSSSDSDNQNHISRIELGLKKEIREMLPIIVYKESFFVNDAQCSVCLGEYQAEDRLQQIPACGHTFHVDCIDLWLAIHTTCPLCRLSLLTSAKSSTELPIMQVEIQGQSSALNNSGTCVQWSSPTCEQFSGLMVRDTRTLQDSAEEDTTNSHFIDGEGEPLDAKNETMVHEVDNTLNLLATEFQTESRLCMHHG